MNTPTQPPRSPGRARSRHAALVAAAAAFLLLVPAPRAMAQEGGGPPSPEEVQEKIREIEKLMKKAEEALARSTSSRQNAADAARRLEELLDEKAREQTGKSSDQLREEAKQGSTSSAEALKKLTEEARSDAAKAGSEMERVLGQGGGSTREAVEGVRKLLADQKIELVCLGSSVTLDSKSRSVVNQKKEELTEFIELAGGPHSVNNWVRGICHLGMMPANGLLYAPPEPCKCYWYERVSDFCALAPGPLATSRASMIR